MNYKTSIPATSPTAAENWFCCSCQFTEQKMTKKMISYCSPKRTHFIDIPSKNVPARQASLAIHRSAHSSGSRTDDLSLCSNPSLPASCRRTCWISQSDASFRSRAPTSDSESQSQLLRDDWHENDHYDQFWMATYSKKIWRRNP